MIGKMPICWHEECLTNIKLSLVDYQKQLARLYERAADCQKDIARIDRQLAEARRRKLSSYDPDRFMKGK